MGASPPLPSRERERLRRRPHPPLHRAGRSGRSCASASSRDELAAAKPKSLVYLSTVGVYGDHAGGWVDEDERMPAGLGALATSGRGRGRHGSASPSETGVPVAIVRLAGIYGPGRGPFEKIRRGTARRIVKPGQVFNRIHVDDIATIVEAAFRAARRRHLQRRGRRAGAAGGCARFMRRSCSAYRRRRKSRSRAPSFRRWREVSTARTKRVRNDRIKRELGVTLAYPTYREGLKAILTAEG